MFIIEILKTVLIGIVEGITEWLPVSSTGHMIILNELIGLKVSDAFWELFEVVIQLGAIMAVVVLYFNRLNPFSLKKTAEERRGTWDLLIKIVIAVIPSAIVGLLFDDWFNEHLYNYVVVAIALIGYGIVFLFLDNRGGRHLKAQEGGITVKTALLIGAFQMLALIPGTSRSGSTIIGAMLLGLGRTESAEFSFFMAIPTMLGASLLKLLKFVMDGSVIAGEEIVILIVGCVTAFAVSMAAVKYLLSYVRSHSFKAFGVYRIVLGAVVILWSIIR